MTKSIRPMVRIHNTETNEIIDREMNDAEFAQFEIDTEIRLAREAELQAKASQRQSILDKLGLTADEARLLLG